MTKEYGIIIEYRRLTSRIDRLSARLTRRFAREMGCRPGCHGCCMNISVFPVEWESIRLSLKGNGQSPDFHPGRICGFLDDDGLCRIYQWRPVICRTHGLPLLYRDDDFKPFVDFCELNFREYRQDLRRFRKQDLVDMEKINRCLSDINSRYAKVTGYDGPPRKEMKEFVSI